MKHLETAFPELHDVLQKGYGDHLIVRHDGSIQCLNNPDPHYYDYRYERMILCVSHPAVLHLYQSECGTYKGVIIHYDDIVNHETFNA